MEIDGKAIRNARDLEDALVCPQAAIDVFQNIANTPEEFFSFIKIYVSHKLEVINRSSILEPELEETILLLSDNPKTFFDGHRSEKCISSLHEAMCKYSDSLPKDSSKDSPYEKEHRKALEQDLNTVKLLKCNLENEELVLCLLAAFFFPPLAPFLEDYISTFKKPKSSTEKKGLCIQSGMLYCDNAFVRKLRTITNQANEEHPGVEFAQGKDGDYFYLREISDDAKPNVGQQAKHVLLPCIPAISISVSGCQWAMTGYDRKIYSNVPFLHKCTDYQFVDAVVSFNHVLGITTDNKLFRSQFGLLTDAEYVTISDSADYGLSRIALNRDEIVLTYGDETIRYRILGQGFLKIAPREGIV